MIRSVAAALLVLPGAAQAQSGGDATVAQTNLRYDEDWASLRDAPHRSADWWQRLKDRPLDADGDLRLTLGAEARARFEGFRDNFWGQPPAPDDGYLWLRFMPLADLHAGPVRGFVQGIAARANGVGAGAGPADTTGVDVLQAFADVRLQLGSRATVTLRGGRELVALGSERLVGLRYGPNVPQAFDGLRGMLDIGSARIEAFDFRPVAVGPGNFDDRSSPTRALHGVYTTLPLAAGAKADLYWLHYENEVARFHEVTGQERRDTFGVRLWGRSGALAWNWEAMLQRGRFESEAIRAWSIASETSYAWPQLQFAPRLRLRANVASGDHDPADRVLGTFNAMFPKGKYFGELSPVGPRNIVNLHPSLDFDLGSEMTAEIVGIAYWRASRSDGIYDVPGQLIRAPGDSRARHIGNQIEASVSWQATPTLSFSASASLFSAGRFLRETGPAEPIHMIAGEVMLRF